jgi:hypothetical protein
VKGKNWEIADFRGFNMKMMNMGKFHRKIMKEIDVWLEQQDTKRDAILNKQRDRALKKIEDAETDLIERHYLYRFTSRQLDEIKIIMGHFKRGAIVWKYLSDHFGETLRAIRSGTYFSNPPNIQGIPELYEEQIYEAWNRGGASPYDRLGLRGPCVEDDYGEESTP